MSKLAEQVAKFRKELTATAVAKNARRHFAIYRNVIALERKRARSRPDPEPDTRDPDYTQLYNLAHEAIIRLGGQDEQSLMTLSDYDSDSFGPLLGVSNEGGATAAIRQGALASPKCVALPN